MTLAPQRPAVEKQGMSSSPALPSVGLIGLGAIGRLHFDCWRQSQHARMAAIASSDPKKRAGEWGGQEFNLGDQSAERVDLTGIATHADAAALFADPSVQIVDICTPTPHHAPLALAALRAGKHVVLEKPMSLSLAECDELIAAARESDRQIMVAHCLRYWPHYVKARELIESGEFGRPLYAKLERTGAIPKWSAGGWLTSATKSGGVLDMHIHDIDVALWWFGRPARVVATGVTHAELPIFMDAQWTYADGPLVNLHSAWDPNGGTFRHAFHLVLEKASITYDLATHPNVLVVHRDGIREEWPMPEPAAHQAELDDFAQTVAAGRPFTRFTPEESRLSVEIGLEELRQIGCKF